MDHTRQSTLFTSVVLLMNILILWIVIIMLSIRLGDSQKKVEDLQAQIVAIEGEVIQNFKEAGRTTCAPDCSCQDMGEVDAQTEETVAPSEPEIITQAYEVPQQSSFKSYTFYTSLSRSSKQWRIQEMAYTDELGFRRVNDAYCVALGTYYGTELGTYYLVTLDTGSKFFCILCDVKSDRHTDSTHRFTVSNGCAIEFYVDPNVFNGLAKRMGNISYVDGFEGEIISIEKILSR